MKNLKTGQELIVTEKVKVHFSNSSSSGYIELPVGTVLLVIKKNERSYTVAYRYDHEIWVAHKEDFILPGFRQDRLKIDDLDKVTKCPKVWGDLIKIKHMYQ
jgi:hypothetical protein